jgi:hypothetical protein
MRATIQQPKHDMQTHFIYETKNSLLLGII